MKASELIKVLQAGIVQHGDLEVYFKHSNGVYGKAKKIGTANRHKASSHILWQEGRSEDLKGEKIIIIV